MQRVHQVVRHHVQPGEVDAQALLKHKDGMGWHHVIQAFKVRSCQLHRWNGVGTLPIHLQVGSCTHKAGVGDTPEREPPRCHVPVMTRFELNLLFANKKTGCAM